MTALICCLDSQVRLVQAIHRRQSLLRQHDWRPLEHIARADHLFGFMRWAARSVLLHEEAKTRQVTSAKGVYGGKPGRVLVPYPVLGKSVDFAAKAVG